MPSHPTVARMRQQETHNHGESIDWKPIAAGIVTLGVSPTQSRSSPTYPIAIKVRPPGGPLRSGSDPGRSAVGGAGFGLVAGSGLRPKPRSGERDETDSTLAPAWCLLLLASVGERHYRSERRDRLRTGRAMHLEAA
jgi:hypothetical protein